MTRTNRPHEPAQMGPGDYAARIGISLDGLRRTSVKHGLAWQPGDRLVPVAEMDAGWDALYARGEVRVCRPGYTGPGPEDGAPERASYEAERARHERAKASLAEAKLARALGELVPVAEVEASLASQAAAVSASWDALPAKIAAELPGDRRDTIRVVRAVIESERSALRAQLLADIEEAEAKAAGVDDIDDEEPDEDPPPAPPPPPKPAKTPRARRAR